METDKKFKMFAGCDWSMSCPAISIWEDRGEPIHFSDVKVHYTITDPKYVGILDNMTGHPMYTEWTCDEERFENLAEWATNLMLEYGVTTVFMENYSFGSRGQVFNIGENGGMLKYFIWKKLHTNAVMIAPAAIKKFAARTGNANKDQMHAAFERETGFSLIDKLNPVKLSKKGKPKKRSTKVGSPIGDIVDSYYVLKCGINQLSSSRESKSPVLKA